MGARRLATCLSYSLSWLVAGRLPVGTKACVGQHEVALGQGLLQAGPGEHGDYFQEPQDPTVDA